MSLNGSPPAPGAPQDRPVVLVVEDEGMVRMLVVQALQDAGYAIREASEALGALGLLERDPQIALLVTDVGLPGLDGRKLAQQAQGLRPDLKVLFMTGYAQTGELERALLPGCDLINKPFQLDELTAKVEALLGSER